MASTVKEFREQPVNVRAIIVSSMGAVYSQSMTEFWKILACSSQEMQKLGR
jgi:hypothetical protein